MRKYLGITQFAERVGVKKGTLERYKLPPADVMVGNIRGWRAKTIDDWNAARPSRRGKHGKTA